MKRMRKPVSTRVPPVDHMACMTGHGIACLRRRNRPSGPSESTVRVSPSVGVCRRAEEPDQPRWVPRSELGTGGVPVASPSAPSVPSVPSARWGAEGIGVVSSMDTSPREESTRSGSRMAWTVPTTKTTNATRSAQAGPASIATPPSAPPMSAPTTPAIDTREFALTRVVPGGSRRGTAAARVML